MTSVANKKTDPFTNLLTEKKISPHLMARQLFQCGQTATEPERSAQAKYVNHTINLCSLDNLV